MTDWPSPTLEDELHYMGATPPARHSHVAPLWILPAAKRDEIERQVLAAEPPPRWLTTELCRLPSRAWYEWHWHRGIDPDQKRASIPPATSAYVIARDGLVCGICRGEVDPSDIHLDHIKPHSKGGGDHAANLRVTHSRCNLRRGNRED